MKDKNKRGLFGLFQNVKRSTEFSEEIASPSIDSSKSLKADDVITEEENESNIPAVPESSAPSNIPIEEDVPASSPFAIWEPSDDPLILHINEELLEIEYRQFSNKMKSLSNVFKRTSAPVQDQEPVPRAAQPQLYISKDRMAAWFYVIPPLNDGPDVSEDNLKAILSQEHITVGVMEDVLKSIVSDRLYDQAILVAKGVLARNGIDGLIKDHYERIMKLEFEEDENGSVDYKNLNNIQSVKEGEVICEIIPAIHGEDGMTVTGQVYPCTIKGTNVSAPAGRNTRLTDDHALLISQRTGHVTFANGKFNVESILKISGNIDNSTGNLDYDGDILITGDVRNGFSVKSTGNIDIKGSVEGAQITAQGSITIASGMSGNGRGSLTADSYIKCRYLEHCTVKALGNVYAESIINSKVESGEDIVVTSGIGVIIGGSLLAVNNITARVIGSKVRRLVTELIIAAVPKHIEESSRLTRELEQLHHNLSEIRKNINYLETTQRADRQQLLDNLKQASDYLYIREQEITNRLDELSVNDTVQVGLIRCQQMLPVVRVRIGSSTLLIQEEYSSSIIYKNSEGEIIVGSN